MQNLHHVRLNPGAQTVAPLVSVYRHLHDMVSSGGQTMSFQTSSEGLATKTKGPAKNATNPPNADPSREDPKTQEG